MEQRGPGVDTSRDHTGHHGAHGHDHDHEHSGSHAHSHGGAGHGHAPTSFGAGFAVAVALNVGIVAAEVGFGLAGHSIALIADAGHNVADVLSLLAACAAHHLARRPPSARFTYGFGRSTIMVALFNAVALLVVSGALSWAALLRLFHPEPVAATAIMTVAGAAIVVNAASAALLAPGKGGDLNMRAAVAHLAADATVAAGVVAGGLLIRLTGWNWIDPLLSLAINAVIVLGTWRLLRESVSMSLAGVPRSVNEAAVQAYLAALPGVAAIHDLHIWPMSTSDTALTAHLVMPAGAPGDTFLMETCAGLRERHGIGHATLQVETDDATVCALAPAHVV